MTDLSRVACITGGVFLAAGLAAFSRPAWCRERARRFPRSVLAGGILTVIDMIWVALIVHGAALGRFEFLKPWIYPAAGVAAAAIIFLMDDLLAARAFGGLLLLAGNPVLLAARWAPTPWRLVMPTLVYIWVLAGMILVLSPWRLRKALERLGGDRGWRLAGVTLGVIGFGVLVLALTVY